MQGKIDHNINKIMHLRIQLKKQWRNRCASLFYAQLTNAYANGVEDTANGDKKYDSVKAFTAEFGILQVYEDGERADQNGKSSKDTPVCWQRSRVDTWHLHCYSSSHYAEHILTSSHCRRNARSDSHLHQVSRWDEERGKSKLLLSVKLRSEHKYRLVKNNTHLHY